MRGEDIGIAAATLTVGGGGGREGAGRETGEATWWRRGAESKPIGRLSALAVLAIAGAGGAGPFSFLRARGTMRGDIPTHRRHLAGGFLRGVNGRGVAMAFQPLTHTSPFFEQWRGSGTGY